MTGKGKMTARSTSTATDERQPSYVKYKLSIHDMENADKPNCESDGKRHADRSRSAGGKRREPPKFGRGAGCPFQRAALLGSRRKTVGQSPAPQGAIALLTDGGCQKCFCVPFDKRNKTANTHFVRIYGGYAAITSRKRKEAACLEPSAS